jgi:GalNAc5-diNAcBac-PP-undecaprenol beta-1,3-glucosyltransferase
VKTVKTVLSQDFRDFEVIIIDDGSTDNTLARVAEEFSGEPKVRYHRKRNEERSVARNFGIKQACGDYVVFFDSDDIMHPNHLSTLEAKIKEFPDCNFFATKFQFDYGNRIAPSHISHLKEGFYDYKILLEGSFFGTLVCVKRNNPFLASFPPEFNICEDWIFNFLNLLNDKIYLIDATTITVVEHEGRSMSQNKKVIKARLLATEYLLSSLNLTEDDAKTMRAGSSRFCAVHAYLDGDRRTAFRFVLKLVALSRFRFSDLILIIKILVGKSFLKKLRLIRS